MRWTTAAGAAALSLSLASSTAHATHPDHEGERGLEAQLILGGAGYGVHDDTMFLPTSELGAAATRHDIFRGGFALRALVGWRFTPYVAAHVGFGVDSLSSANDYAASESALGAKDSLSAINVSLHARFYWLSLLNGARTNPRVFFRGWGDVRRMESWISLGVEFFHRIQRERTYGANDAVIRYTAEYTGVPLGVGYDFRFTPSLSAGVSLALTPLLGQSMTRYQRFTQGTGAASTVIERTQTYDTLERSNSHWFLGLGVRYTWTMF